MHGVMHSQTIININGSPAQDGLSHDT